jgi:hypothetical protein
MRLRAEFLRAFKISHWVETPVYAGGDRYAGSNEVKVELGFFTFVFEVSPVLNSDRVSFFWGM